MARRRKPKHTVRINAVNLRFTEEGIFISQGSKTYKADVTEVDDQEYFTIVLPHGHKVWVEIDYTEK